MESYTCQNQNQNQNQNNYTQSSIKPPRPRTTPLERHTEHTLTHPPQKFPLYTHTHLIKHARAKAKEEESQNRGRALLFSFAFSIISVLLCSIKRLSFKVKVVPFWTTWRTNSKIPLRNMRSLMRRIMIRTSRKAYEKSSNTRTDTSPTPSNLIKSTTENLRW